MLNDKIYVAGHRGMVGSAIVRELQEQGFTNIITATSKVLDLRDQNAVRGFFTWEKPDYVILAAAKVGGINANMKYQADFMYDNLMIQTNVIHEAWKAGVKKLVFLGSSCIYPRNCPQPMKEEYILDGKLEPTNEGYAVAKLAGLKMAEYYYRQHGFKAISIMPPNLYGPNDSFDLEHSHVLSALVRRFCEAVATDAPSVTVWGTGSARREFMHVHDMAAATVFMLQHYDEPSFLNVGTAEELSIRDLAEMIATKTGYKGEIVWDSTKPDGMPLKCMDVTRMKATGFMPKIALSDGLSDMIAIYRTQMENKG